ncbi:MAG: glycosyltransferase family 4 protein [Phormidesmis sp. CAN_BIN36]|nr:glycosyltransferase family 4 protein [Phormidesmis sp. CAN_BIN36]
MTRIALIAGIYAPDRCGVADYTDRLRIALSNHAIESVVLTTIVAANEPTGRGVVNDWHIKDLLALVRAVHRSDIEILHIQHAAGTYGFDRAIFLLPLLLRITGWRKPIVTTVHEYGWWEWQPAIVPPKLLEWLKTWGQKQGWWDREDGFLLTQSDAIITTNRDAKEVILDRLPHLKGSVYKITNRASVEVAELDRAIACQKVLQNCGWSDEVAIAAFFGFLHPVKGLETLLPAFKQVLETQPHARLLLVGGVESLALSGEDARQYWQQLKQTISALNLENHIHMTGYLEAERASQFLAGVDVGVLPFNHGVTLKSGSLLALMAHKLPVIATRSNKVDHELDNNSLIKMINPRDIEELTYELINLSIDPALRNQLGLAGQSFSHKFSWSRIAENYLNVYRSVQSDE